MPASSRSHLVVMVTGIIYALVGLALAGGGAWLAALGGSLYYLIAGLGTLIAGMLLIARRRAALWVYAAVLIEVDLAGARAIKRVMPEAFTVFLAPPSWAVLEARLTRRGTESADVMQRRLATAREELAAQADFDAVVVNSELEAACEELIALLGETAPDTA